MFDWAQRCPQGRANLPCTGALPCPVAGQGEIFIFALPCKITGQDRAGQQGGAGQTLRALQISHANLSSLRICNEIEK